MQHRANVHLNASDVDESSLHDALVLPHEDDVALQGLLLVNLRRGGSGTCGSDESSGLLQSEVAVGDTRAFHDRSIKQLEGRGDDLTSAQHYLGEAARVGAARSARHPQLMRRGQKPNSYSC